MHLGTCPHHNRNCTPDKYSNPLPLLVQSLDTLSHVVSFLFSSSLSCPSQPPCMLFACSAYISSTKLSDVIASSSNHALNLFHWPTVDLVQLQDNCEVHSEARLDYRCHSHLISSAYALQFAGFSGLWCIDVTGSTSSLLWTAESGGVVFLRTCFWGERD